MEAIVYTYASLDGFPPEMRPVFEALRAPDVGWDMLVNQNMFVEQVVPASVVRKLTDAEMDAIGEPFKDPASRKPLWR